MQRSREAAVVWLATSRNVSVDRSGGTEDVRLDMSKETGAVRGEASWKVRLETSRKGGGMRLETFSGVDEDNPEERWNMK